MNERVYDSAAALIAKGIPVVVVWGVNYDGSCACPKGKDCPAKGKHPMGTGWQNNPITDEDALYDALVEASGPRNIGILLGPQGGLVDIEHDTEEGEETAKALGLPFVGTPQFRSSRSTHYLFRFNDRLPKKAALPNVHGLECRLGSDGRGAQSIAPGSTHHTGVIYDWLDGRSIEDLDVQEVPENLMRLIEDDARSTGASGADLTVENALVEHGGRHDAIRRLTVQLAGASRSSLTPKEENLIFTAAMAMNQVHCRPPLEEAEVRALMTSAFSMINRTREEKPRLAIPEIMDEVEGKFLDRWSQVDAGGDVSLVMNSDAENTLISTGLKLCDDGWHPGSWACEIVDADPVLYNIVIPCVGRKVRVQFTAAEFNKPDIVAARILETTRNLDVSPYPGFFQTAWLGRKGKKGQPPENGLKSRLVASATTIKGGVGEYRFAPAAIGFIDILRTADPEVMLDAPEVNGEPAWVLEHGIVFKWENVVSEIRNRVKGVAEEDLRNMRLAFEGHLGRRFATVRISSGSQRLRYIKLSEAEFDSLADFVDGMC